MKKLIKVLDWLCITLALLNCGCFLVLYGTINNHYIPELYKTMLITCFVLSIICIVLFVVSFVLSFIREFVLKQDIKEKQQLDDIQSKLDYLLSKEEGVKNDRTSRKKGN